MGGVYETLSPWADVDPTPLAGINPRLGDLKGKRIGLFHNNKPSGEPMLSIVQDELGTRFEGMAFERFGRRVSAPVAETTDRGRYEEWVKGVDAVVLAVGD